MDIPNLQLNALKKAFLTTGISVILGLLFNYFFYDKLLGIGVPIYIALIVIGLFTISAYLKKKIDNQVLWLLIPLGFFSLMVFVRSSLLLTFLNIIGSLLLLLLIAKISFAEKIKTFLIFDYIKIFFLPLKFLIPLFLTIFDVFTLQGVKKDSKTFLQIGKGIIITLPVVIIFLVLFSSADLIFQKYIADITTITLQPETVIRSILVLMVTLAFTGAYSYIFSNQQETTPQKTNQSYIIGNIEISILLGAVNVLFFAFILVQLTYLFGGVDNIASQGFTYAEYARKGFFELIAVAIISFFLLFTTEKYIIKKDTEHTLVFKILSTALIVQVILIMVSAFKRLLLYEEAYGFTTLRLYSHAFIIFLAIIFILLLYKIYKDKRENAFAFRAFVSIIIFLALMNILNPDLFIAQQNIERFATTGKLDISYLSRLSDDAIPETIKILNIQNENLRKNFARELYWQTQTNSFRTSQWQSLNISRMNANNILKAKMAELEQYKNYQQQKTILPEILSTTD